MTNPSVIDFAGTIMTWNPAVWPYPLDEWDDLVAEVKESGASPFSWSCRLKEIPIGTRVYWLRQGTGARGIVAVGITTGEVFEGEHYLDPSKQARYIDFELNQIVTDPDEPLPIELLEDQVSEVRWRYLMGAGAVRLAAASVEKLDALWDNYIAGNRGIVGNTYAAAFSPSGSEYHILYRMYNEKHKLLYVGITRNALNRFSGHLQTQIWFPEVAHISLEYYATRDDLREAEKHIIQYEQPRYNKDHPKPTGIRPSPLNGKRVVK